MRPTLSLAKQMFLMQDIEMANILTTNANLLVAFDLLARELSVTGAAKRYGITQSAMSSVLAQLRELFEDPLLVRVGNAMRLTPRGAALAEQIRAGVALLADALEQPSGFDPRSSRQRFVVAMSDFIELVVLPRLVERLRQEAPQVDLQVVPWVRGVPPAALAEDLDLALGIFSESESTQPLFDTRFVCIVRQRHPRVKRRLTLSTYVDLGHVLMTDQLGDEGVVDVALRLLGLSRRIALRVPHFSVVPHIVANSDLVAAVDEPVARHFAGLLPIRILEPPLELPRAVVRMAWHERTARDPARVWLRGVIQRAAAEACERAVDNR